MNCLITSLVFFTSVLGFAADKAVIQQMKGRRAIIQFEKDIPFSVGQRLFINSADGSELGVRRDARNPLERKNSVGLSSTIVSLGTKPKSDTTAIAGRYGWNKNQYEYGPIIEISNVKTASTKSDFNFGGFFEYNIIPNNPGEDFVWGAFGEVKMGNSKTGSAKSVSTTDMMGGAFAKWFIFSPMLALRADLFTGQYKLDKKGYTKTGIAVGLNHYF